MELNPERLDQAGDNIKADKGVYGSTLEVIQELALWKVPKEMTLMLSLRMAVRSLEEDNIK